MKKNAMIILLMIGLINSGFSQETEKSLWKSRYVNYTDFGVLLGKSYQITNYGYSYTTQAKTNFTAQTFNGLKVYKNLAVGATVGLDWLGTYQIVPVSLGLRKPFGKDNTKRVRPFLALDAGYGFTWLSDATPQQTIKGGISYSPAIGLMIPTGGGTSITLSAGYKHNEMTITEEIDDAYYRKVNENNYNRFAVKIGVSF